ncbi:carbohydrate kinase family protein [Rouxiella silvae]|uniref:Carbohydrate kinase family protein n=1 Tax=Rouxiella silvae TaxID=1646373 RepID=A0AA40X1S9_9GAMM|nr:carbohydrate kinase family protein [Rouxiella silvae]MBF6637015.1 carbohydrate kinase family protein [Rouxiella silvae]
MNAGGKVLFVGDISLDTTLRLGYIPQPDEKLHVKIDNESAGGVISNAALACRLAGGRPILAIETGDDLFADSLLATLQQAGIEIVSRKIPGRTCRAIILIEPHGEKRLLLEPGVSLYPSVEWVQSLSLTGIDWVHTAVYGDAAWPLIEQARLAGSRWSLDLEPATFIEGIAALTPLLEGAEVVFCNQRALDQLGEHPEQQLLDRGVKAVVSTLGARGATYVSAIHRADAHYPLTPNLVDTTGAGDCLAGWFIACMLAGKSPKVSLTEAVYAATYSCERAGAQPSYPDRQQLAAFQQASQR